MTDLQIINFDSVNSIYDNLNDPFSTTYKLSNPIKHIERIYLKSIELPIQFLNVRNSGSLNVFTINIGGTNYSITLNANNYTSIASLCSDITSAFSLLTLPNNAVFLMSANSYVVTVSLTALTLTNFSIVGTQLSWYILGFKNASSQSNSTNGSNHISSIVALNTFNLSIDNYCYMWISNIPVSNYSSQSVPCSFKILLNGLLGSIIYESDESTFKQYIDISDPYFILNSFKVQFFDRFGNQLLNNGNDYSFTLGFKISNNYLDE